MFAYILEFDDGHVINLTDIYTNKEKFVEVANERIKERIKKQEFDDGKRLCKIFNYYDPEEHFITLDNLKSLTPNNQHMVWKRFYLEQTDKLYVKCIEIIG